MDPRIYLAIDNCFASKRWVRPSEWLRIIDEIGLKYIEASADTECDPMYMAADFTQDWIRDVGTECAKRNMHIANVYSGHGTYATCGLTHYDPRVVRHFLDHWIKPQMRTALALGANFGFFAHGIENLALQSADMTACAVDRLYNALAEIARYAAEIGLSYAGIEQMYSPHQPPWTLDGAGTLLREVYRRAGTPFYLTLDTGHMNGQRRFLRPDGETLLHNLKQKSPPRLWLGSENARKLYADALTDHLDAQTAAKDILADANRNPQLFAQPQDCEIEEWIRRFGCYSPIMHLQQTDGLSSPHWPFSHEYNKKGIVHAQILLTALCEAFDQTDDPRMPPKCKEVMLTLEPFLSTAGNPYDLIDLLKESIAYWRRWIPEDGMKLSEIRGLLARRGEEENE